MAYAPYYALWKNFPDTTTPLVAAALNNIETGIGNAVEKPASIASGEAAVWNGSAWARSSVTPLGLSSIAQGGATSGQVLTWNGSAWAPAAGGASLVTALPGSPTDGQEIIYTDSLTAPTYQWRLRYVSGKASNKWIFIGGTPLQAIQTGGNGTTSATYVTLTGDPSITIPIAGDYNIEHGTSSNSSNQAGNRGWSSYSVGATASADSWSASFYTDTVNFGGGSRKMKWSAIAASTVIQMQHKVIGGGTPSIGFINRFIAATPIAIGG